MKMLKVISTILVFNTFVIINTNTAKDYGKFKMSIIKINQCKGPKREDCCKLYAEMVNKTHIIYDIQIVKKITPNRGKILVTMNDKQFLRLQMKKPCDHLFLKPLFQTILNGSQNCEFPKGKYRRVIDVQKITSEYYKGEFLYGNMTFKSLFYSDEYNFSCMEITSNFAPEK